MEEWPVLDRESNRPARPSNPPRKGSPTSSPQTTNGALTPVLTAQNQKRYVDLVSFHSRTFVTLVSLAPELSSRSRLESDLRGPVSRVHFTLRRPLFLASNRGKLLVVNWRLDQVTSYKRFDRERRNSTGETAVGHSWSQGSVFMPRYLRSG